MNKILTDFGIEQTEYFSRVSPIKLKKLGQYFTSKEVASYMASMLKAIPNVQFVKILDAGAGAGILASAAAIRCLDLGYKQVHVVLYEVDKSILSLLKKNMDKVKELYEMKDAKLSFEIRNEDFVLTRPDKNNELFHYSVVNPPYFKYNSKNSPYGRVTEDLFKGDPNIYASFIAIINECLTSKGQLVAIIPRSFTNGLYFKDFRRCIISSMSLSKIHIFKSRKRVFKDMDVLQENIICKLEKTQQKKYIQIATSECKADLHKIRTKAYLAVFIIDQSNEYNIIRIPETSNDKYVLEMAENWDGNFTDNGYYISTGPVVEFRARKYITSSDDANSTPLFRMHNVRPFRTEWTGKHRKDVRFTYLEGYKKYTISNDIYVMLKRFSSKDEKRRLVAGVHDRTNFKVKEIGCENHLNYIGLSNGRLSLTEAYGIAALFNSTFMDRYFRCISGNTQVNATEIRLLKMPQRTVIRKLGQHVVKSGTYNQDVVDNIVESILCL